MAASGARITVITAQGLVLADSQSDPQTMENHAGRPELKLPPIVGVLTHVDLLSPAMEWAPPYDWLHPQRPKEQQMRQAVQAALDQFSGRLSVVVPVCAGRSPLTPP